MTAPRRATGPVHPDPHEQLITQLQTLTYLWEAAANRRANHPSLMIQAEHTTYTECAEQLQDIIRKNPT